MDMVSAGGLPGLPTGWCWSTLGSVLPINYGKALPERDRVSTGAIPVFGSSGCVGSHSESIAPADSILIGRKGSAGSVFFSNVPSWPIDTAYFTAGSPPVDIRYGYWFLRFHQLAKLDQSTAIPSLSRDIYDVQRIPLAPLAEQRRIVARIDALFAEIAEGEAALAEARKGLDIFRRALLKAAVTGELTKDWRAKNLETETAHELLVRIAKDRESMPVIKWRARLSPTARPLDTASLSVLPESWAWVRAEDITSLITKGTTPPQHTMTREGEIPYLKIQNLDFDGRLHFDRTKQFIDRDTHSAFLARSKIYPGDLLINIVGPPLGQTAVVPSDFPEWNINQAIAVLRCLPGIVVDYVNLFLMSPVALAEFEMRSKATSGQVNVTLEVCRNVAVPLPPSAEASEIVRQVSEALIAVDETFRVLDAEAADVARLKQSILKAAFEGRLVPQDPTDEPASALLARLAAGRSEVPAKPGRVKSATSKGLALQ